MKKRLLVLAPAAAFVGGWAIWMAGPAPTSASRSALRQVNVSRSERPIIEASKPSASSAESAPAAPPRAVVDQSEYDFGVLEPHTQGSHTFTIRNEGLGPLELSPGGKTCKCAELKIHDRRIAPGGEGRVSIAWNLGNPSNEYRHGGTVRTNDPNLPEVQLRVFGEVRTRVAASPTHLDFGGIAPDEPAAAETVLYSRKWDRLAFSDVEASHDGFTWTITPAEDEVKQELDARCAYRVRVNAPNSLPQGAMSGWLRMQAAPEQLDGEPLTIEIPIVGEGLSRLAVFGEQINHRGVVDLGTLDAGRGARASLLVKVRDKRKAIAVKSIETEPKFVEVNLEPFRPEQGLYRLHLRIPTNAPSGNYLSSGNGHVRVMLEHPRISGLEIKLNFAVIGGQ